MNKISFFIIGISISISLSGQNKHFTVKDTEIGIRKELAPQSLQNIQWRENSMNFTYQKKDTLFQQSVKKCQPIKLITLRGLNTILLKAGKDSISGFPTITWDNENEFSFTGSTGRYLINIIESKLINYIKLPEDADNKKFNYFAGKIAYTLDNNVYIAGNNGTSIQVSHDKDSQIVNGQTVSRNEFGIEEGIFWSPKGNYLAFYRKDNRNVADYPLVDVTSRESTLKNIKYPMAGMASEHVSLGVYNLTTGVTHFIENQDSMSEKYLTNITWAPDEKNIYIQVLNREQKHMLLNQYHPEDGSFVKTLFEEQHDKYMEPLDPLIFLHTDPTKFIYQSRRDGYKHAYIYNTEGKVQKQLTAGNWELTSILSLDDQDNLWYMSCQASPIDAQAYCINAITGKKVRITQSSGTHSLIVQKNGKYWIDDYSNTTTPRIINLVSANGSIVRNLVTSPNPLQEYAMPRMEIGTIKAADGVTDLYYRLIKPIDFDSTRQYPAIIYVYGGPHAQLVTNRWLGGARLWEYMMAQKGYVIFTVDNRGSANRGLAFENVIHRQCGVNEMLDQMEGVKFLRNLRFIDMNRLGVHGWSYGGFMSISLMTHYPEIFKAGVAGGPVIDWKYYEVMYGERYMDTPQANVDGYKSTSLLPMVKNLKGKLLIIQGAQDNTVVWQHSQLFLQACIKSSIPVDYFVYPLSEHNVRGTDRMHLMDKVTRYFDDYLK